MRPPVRCLVQYADVTVVIEIPPSMGDSASVARRLRSDGLAAVRRGAEVIVNGQADVPPHLVARHNS